MDQKSKKTAKVNVEPPLGEVTELLARVRIGEPDAMNCLMDAVYARIHQIACQITAVNGIPTTLTPTAVLHESFARIQKASGFGTIRDRNHLYATFARTTRNVLVDYARRKAAKKRGGGKKRVELDQILLYLSEEKRFDLLELKDALDVLAAESPRAAQVVEMRFFGGLTMEHMAESLGISAATAYADWQFARARLAQLLEEK